MKCKYHCCEKEVPKEGRPKDFCSLKCKNKYFVDRRRIEMNFKAHQYKGAKCEICGHTGLPAEFDFHHLDPSTKEFQISHPHTRSWEKMRAELDKCQLLCACCHRKVEFEKTMHKKHFINDFVEKYGGCSGIRTHVVEIPS